MIALPPLPAASMRPRQRTSASRDIKPISSSGMRRPDSESQHGERDVAEIFRTCGEQRRRAERRPDAGAPDRAEQNPDGKLPGEDRGRELRRPVSASSCQPARRPRRPAPAGAGPAAPHPSRSAAPRRPRETHPDRARSKSRWSRRTDQSRQTTAPVPRRAPRGRTGVRRSQPRSRSGSAARRRATGPTAILPAMPARYSSRSASGADLTFATHPASSSKSECQIQSSTRIQYLLVVL